MAGESDHVAQPPSTQAMLASRDADGAGAERTLHDTPMTTRGAAKAFSTEAQACTPVPGAKPKVVQHESTAVEFADAGHALIFDIAGIAVELPACTPDADVRMTTVSWETRNRPTPARIHPKFTRHAATLNVDRELKALERSPILVRLHSKRELTKPGEKLVLAVEVSGECEGPQKREQLTGGDCSHWQLFDTAYDAQGNDMVARLPATGGYRLQFGWVPTK